MPLDLPNVSNPEPLKSVTHSINTIDQHSSTMFLKPKQKKLEQALYIQVDAARDTN